MESKSSRQYERPRGLEYFRAHHWFIGILLELDQSDASETIRVQECRSLWRLRIGVLESSQVSVTIKRHAVAYSVVAVSRIRHP